MNKTFLTDKPERIKEERKRLGYTQAEVAEKCGIRRQQWIRYEKGQSAFDGEPFRKFGDLGASLSYILTGQRSNVTRIVQEKVEQEPMNKLKIELNENFDKLDVEGQVLVMNMAKVLAKQRGMFESFLILGMSLSIIVSMILLHFAKIVGITMPNVGIALGCLSIFVYMVGLVLFFTLLKITNRLKICFFQRKQV